MTRLFDVFAKCVAVPFVLACALTFMSGKSSLATDEPDSGLVVYLNADLTHTAAVGQSLLIGLKAGLSVGATRFDGPEITVIPRDHRNNMRRTQKLLSEAAANPQTLAVFGGMHSPHYLKYGPDFNDNDLVLLLPWSAGAPLTRLATEDENYIFRLSVDDRKVAPFLAERAINAGCARLGIVALDNGWGKGNARALSDAIVMKGGEVVSTTFLRREASKDVVRSATDTAKVLQPDCMILVLASQGSAFVANVLAEWDVTPNVISHWAIRGGGFYQNVDPAVWSKLTISVLSTCLNDAEHIRADQLAEAVTAAHHVDASIARLEDIPSPMAFAHAYDLALVLKAAVAEASPSAVVGDDRVSRSKVLRTALETIETPVEGVLKQYATPYSPVTGPASDGHEALGPNDLCLSKLNPRDGAK